MQNVRERPAPARLGRFFRMLVGDGPVAGRLRERIALHRLGESVILTGPVRRDEVPRYIAAMDICVLPDSNNYGSPMVLFEFMAMGKAIVAADLPPIRDVVQNGETGLLVERGNSAAIEQAIRLLADNPQLRERLGRQARQAVMERIFRRSIDNAGFLFDNGPGLFDPLTSDFPRGGEKPHG